VVTSGDSHAVTGSTVTTRAGTVSAVSAQPLLRIAPRADTEGGRGLLLVEAISDRWGWHPAGAPGLVKMVWAELVGPGPELREHRRNPVVRPGVQGP
jgi:hypothetical protein